jgi:hypothetical protein
VIRRRRTPAALGLACALGAAAIATIATTATTARAQARPDEQDMFGGGDAPTTAKPPAATPAAPAPAPATPAAASGAPAAAAAATPPPLDGGSDRDQSVLGSAATEAEHGYTAPDNPLQIGGQLYLRSQSSARQGQAPAAWTFSAPSLLDVYLDARPNPRVRAFILGRMSYDPTVAPGGVASTGMLASGSGGAFSGGSATGFTTFNASRGPNAVLDQMWIRFDILQRVFVTAGKQHVRWGTGRFWQPTDYLHPQRRNPLDVFDARAGTTMLKLHVPWEDRGWNFYGFGVVESPDQATNTLNQLSAGARAEVIIGGAEVGLDTLVKNGARPKFGIDVSTGIYDFDVYADVGLRAGDDFNTVQRVADPPNSDVTCLPNATTTPPIAAGTAVNKISDQYTIVRESGVKTQAVLGLNWTHKYNDNDLYTIGAEYFYNQPGYSDTSLYPGLLLNNKGTPMLNFFYTGRQYAALFASFPAPYSWNYSTFTLSTLSNLSDLSFISRLDYSVTILTHLSVEAFAGVHYGSDQGEFRLGFKFPDQYTVQAGQTPAAGSSVPCDVTAGSSTQPLLLDVGVALRLKI